MRYLDIFVLQSVEGNIGDNNHATGVTNALNAAYLQERYDNVATRYFQVAKQ